MYQRILAFVLSPKFLLALLVINLSTSGYLGYFTYVSAMKEHHHDYAESSHWHDTTHRHEYASSGHDHHYTQSDFSLYGSLNHSHLYGVPDHEHDEYAKVWDVPVGVDLHGNESHSPSFAKKWHVH